MDREKIVNAFVLCRVNEGCSTNCPYWNSNASVKECTKKLATDVYSLLKEQEPLAVDEGKLNKCVCGNEINRYWHPEYCGFCGKKLEWY